MGVGYLKQLLLCLAFMELLLGCEGNFFRNNTEEIREDAINKKEKMETETWEEVPLQTVAGLEMIPVSVLIEKTNEKAHFDKINKTLTLFIGDDQYYLIHNVPVVQRNGLLIPGSKDDFKIIENQPWISINFLNDTAGLQIKLQNNKALVAISEATKKRRSNYEVTEATYLGSVENVIDIMSVLESPIRGANVDTIPSHLPGAKRSYRNGVHEGLDWYGYSTGVPINRGTEVFAMGDGIVIRADHKYNRYSSKEERNSELQIADVTGFTPTYILDRLRGRQVWIQYENGLQARFAHLDRISTNLRVGDTVTADTLVGYVGNSGTSGDVNGDNTELHLHLDLLYKGELFWKGLSQDEIKKVLTEVFTG